MAIFPATASIMKNKILKSKISKGILCAAVWLGLWELFAQNLGQAVILPAPHAVLIRLFELVKDSSFYAVCFYSLGRIFVGFLIGVAVGTILAAVSHVGADFLFSPVMTVIKSTPVASIIIILLFFIRRDFVPIAATFLMVLPIVYTNVFKGMSSVPREIDEIARVYSFSRAKKLKYCIIPSVAPFFCAAVKTSIGLAWKSGVAAEVICVPGDSIGTMLNNAKTYLESEDLFAWTLTVILLSFAIEKLLGYGLEKLIGGRAHD